MKRIAVSFFLLLNLQLLANDDRNSVPSQLKTVTVYKSGAELNHTASATLKQGNNELVIDNIANAIDINSIQIKTDKAVTLMGIEFNNNYLAPEEKSAKAKMLEDSIGKIVATNEKLRTTLSNNNELYELLRTNRDIKGTQSGMSVSELMKLMDYYKLKMQEIEETKATITEKMKKNEEVRSKLQQQLNEETKKNTSTWGRLVLQLTAAMAGKFDFTVSYVARNAYWTPYYDVRADDTKSPLKLITKAKISQTTGIDWKQVKLSLSTSVPSQWGNAPLLNAWYLSYINPVYKAEKSLSTTMNSIQSLDDVVVIGYGTSNNGWSSDGEDLKIRGSNSINQNSEPLYVVNGAPMSKSEFTKISPSSIKSVDVLKDAAATSIYGSRGANGVIVVTLKDGLSDYISVAENALNQTYDIDLPYDVPTNGKVQNATIGTMEVNAGFKHYDVPKLDKDAYLLAEIPGWDKLNLLPGEANIIVEGTYIGKSFIDPQSTNDTLNLTLGRDKKVIVKRDKLVDFSSVKFLGSNKLQKFTYEITVRNTKKEDINLLLKDQYPLTTSKEIEVELVDAGGAEINADLGILNWKLKLAPGETKKVRFTYSIKYPKGKTLNIN